MHPFRSISNDSYARDSSFQSWMPFDASTNLFGIDGLSPQADAVVHNAEIRRVPVSQSPIGIDNTHHDYIVPRGESAPAHIRNIFSPSERSESLLKALTLSPNATSSEPELTDEDPDFESFSLPSAMSEHEEFLMGMGGMEDLGGANINHDYSTHSSNSRFTPQNSARNMYNSNSQHFTPRRSASHSFGNFNSYNSLQVPHQQQPQQQNFGFTPSIPSFDHFAPQSSNFNAPRSEPSSYESSNYFQLNQQPRSPTNRQALPNMSKSSMGYRTVATNQFSQTREQSPPSNFDESPPGQSSQWGEHPYGEHPSRTLFVRNINSNVEEAELKELFEEYGDIRSMYTSCKHRGFVMISYYDIRHAKMAMRSLQGKNLRRRKLDIHYSIPKENPPEKDQNQGTLVVFNLDPSITKEELREIFGVHGEIKEIRETPNKRHHKFIEFYDVRCAEQAMKVLNKTEIKSKKIKIEPSRPGGRKSQNSARDDNSLSHSPDNNSFMSDYSNISKSAPSPPNLFHQTPNSMNALPDGTFNVNLQRRRIPDQPAPAWPSSNAAAVAAAPGHRPLRSISLPPGGNPNSPPDQSHNSSNGTHTNERRSRADDKRQFTLDITAVEEGHDRRTTLMIKNIPNKYTQKMLLSTVDETHKGLYDFFYLPIDFKNKCNVGYAFINFIDPKSIVSFYQQLHNTKWDKFNSEKVCNIAYARIQGKDSLIAHFQNSSLMSEDKKCRPIIFHSTGPKMGQQAPFPVGSNVRSRAKEEKRGPTNGDRMMNSSSKRRLRSFSCK